MVYVRAFEDALFVKEDLTDDLTLIVFDRGSVFVKIGLEYAMLARVYME